MADDDTVLLVLTRDEWEAIINCLALGMAVGDADAIERLIHKIEERLESAEKRSRGEPSSPNEGS